ncbi:MAG: cren protein [Candidatus Methanomethylicota archaeon]|nr:cren protein [Candidatus Culexmicrobium cathedralense]RLE47901.1 MAG: cren protein [Candidatus Verstraetearchaeota archaeon]
MAEIGAQPKVDPPFSLRVDSIEDLARFVANIAALGQPTYVLHFKHGGKDILGIIAIYRDYYKFYGMPIFYYYESDEEVKGKYFLVKAEERGERVVLAEGVRPGWIAVPIIRLKEKPPFILI